MKTPTAGWLTPLLLLLSLIAGCATPLPLPTVAQVDLDRYLGTWYEIALIPNRFQAQCVSDTQADYRRDGEAIRVLNRCRTASGEEESASGIARVVADSGNARLRVSFFRPFYGDYWVLALDPDYRWVLVGEPRRQYGWILSRTPALDPAVLKALLDRAEALGYARDAFRPSPQSPLPDTPRFRCEDHRGSDRCPS
ncbi:MAG TPA: lipocalin family protein [Azospira sp.]|nr:lipocalin family protein [Azospira sp.]